MYKLIVYFAMLSHFCYVKLFAIPCTVKCHPPLSMGFSRQEYLSGLPLPAPGDLPDQGMKHTSLVSPVLAGAFFTMSLLMPS